IYTYFVCLWPFCFAHNVYIANCYAYPPPYDQNGEILPTSNMKYDILRSLLSNDESKAILENIMSVRNNSYSKIFSYDRIVRNNEFRIYGSEIDELYWGSIQPPNSMRNALVIDGGAYTGDSVLSLCSAISQYVLEYYAFEPSITSFNSLNKNPKSCCGHYGKLIPLNLCLSDCNNVVKFSLGNITDRDNQIHMLDDGEDVICDKNVEIISTVALDNMSFDESCDIFIKMDIEGSEMKALNGAEKLIRERKPNLAICVYHKPNDIVDIPLYLKSLVPEYKIYLTGGPHTICQAQVET
ncbi:MAG: FkbM family methyltransferase, partial [Methanocorpusculum sp.]|nr:FkbM family methyltransferase [Methanocorpusculum sp.]